MVQTILFPDGPRRFAARASTTFVVLLVLWLPIRGPWAAAFQVFGNLIVETLDADREVDFMPIPANTREALSIADTRISIGRSGDYRDISSFKNSYVPLALFTCLAFASSRFRLSGWRRGWAVGFAFVMAFITLSMALTIRRELVRGSGTGFYDEMRGLDFLLYVAYRTIVYPPGVECLLPTFIWLLSVSLWPPLLQETMKAGKPSLEKNHTQRRSRSKRGR
jgi:hypothetical protein